MGERKSMVSKLNQFGGEPKVSTTRSFAAHVSVGLYIQLTDSLEDNRAAVCLSLIHI